MHDLPADVALPAPDAPWWRQRAAWLYNAVNRGLLQDHVPSGELREYPLEWEVLGAMTFPGGQLLLADPYVGLVFDAKPIAQRLQEGAYQVAVVRAEVGTDHQRIAAAVLCAGTEPVSEWHMAHWEGQDVATLGPEEFFGYDVDAGTGSFASVDGGKVAGEVLGADGGMVDDPISRGLSTNHPIPGAVLVSPQPGAPEIAAFLSGWGDGTYPTWLGVTDSGAVAVAITDFLLAGDPFAKG